MSVDDARESSAILAYELLRAGAEAELQLLKRERKAGKRLADALALLAKDERRLIRAHQRVAQRMEAVTAAENHLREAQTRRATGPTIAQD